MTEHQEYIVYNIEQSLAQGRFFTVSALSLGYLGGSVELQMWLHNIATKCDCEVSFNGARNTYIFTPKDNPSIEDVSWRSGFEAAKKVAIICAKQSQYWGNCIRGCKAVQHSIEMMEMMNPDRFNHDGTFKPEPTVEYDRAKHGPLVNGKVQR